MYPPKGNDAERTVDSGTHDEDDGEDDDDNDDDDDDDDDADGGGSGDHEVDLDMVDADSISIDDNGYVSARPSVVVSPPVVSSTIKDTYKLTNIIIIHGLVILQAIQLKLPQADNFRKLTAGRNFTQDICTSVCSIHNKLRHLPRELLKNISITFCFR